MYKPDQVLRFQAAWEMYHALHSADKWFINPFIYDEPDFHTGMLNGQTAVTTGQFPMWVSDTKSFIDDGVFFGRYRKA